MVLQACVPFHSEVWILACQPIDEVLLEGHVHLPHGGVVLDAQQLVPSVCLVDVQHDFEVVSGNSVHIPKSHAIALNTQGS